MGDLRDGRGTGRAAVKRRALRVGSVLIVVVGVALWVLAALVVAATGWIAPEPNGP